MSDVGFAMEAKSDQLNAVDIMGFEPVITIRNVVVKKGEQPVSIYYNGDNNRPWKPSKGMIRVLAAAWGRDSAAWVGKSAQIYCDPTVRYAGQEVGGVRIRALSDIDKRGMTFILTLSKQKRAPYPVSFLNMERAPYPQDRFEKGLPAMIEKMKSGDMTLSQIIAQCQKTGELTPEQIGVLEDNAPVEVTDNEDFNGFEQE